MEKEDLKSFIVKKLFHHGYISGRHTDGCVEILLIRADSIFKIQVGVFRWSYFPEGSNP